MRWYNYHILTQNKFLYTFCLQYLHALTPLGFHFQDLCIASCISHIVLSETMFSSSSCTLCYSRIYLDVLGETCSRYYMPCTLCAGVFAHYLLSATGAHQVCFFLVSRFMWSRSQHSRSPPSCPVLSESIHLSSIRSHS